MGHHKTCERFTMSQISSSQEHAFTSSWLKFVFPCPNLGKYRDIRRVLHPQTRLQPRIIRSQEWVGESLLIEGRRHGRTTICARRFYPLDSRDKVRIVRVKGQRKSGVPFGIFMARADDRVIGQCTQLFHALPHLCGCPLEQATATHRHQAVGGEGELRFWHVEGDVADCVAVDL